MLMPIKEKFSKKKRLKIITRFHNAIITQPTLRGTAGAIFALYLIAVAPGQ